MDSENSPLNVDSKVGDMEVKEVEVIKKEKIYELTQSEYEKLIADSRKYGSNKTKEYIIFCYNNFVYKKTTVCGIIDFVKDLMDFVIDKNDYIRNVYKLSFWNWLEQHR